MATEIMQWETLDHHQASLMVGRVVAASLCVFGKAAQQAGIGLLNGTRFTVTAGEHTYDSVTWPDNTMPQTTCYIMSNDKQSNDEPLAFARITDHPKESQYLLEGVALNIGSGGASSRLYGIGCQPYGAMGRDTSVAAAGLGFFSRAMAAARQRERALRYASPGETPAVVGMRGDKVSSLVSSLITLDANLLFGLSMNEQGRITDRTYDQAQAMLKKVISDSLAGKPSSATVLHGPGGQPSGALFASDEYGLTVIRRINTYPQTIALTLAARPDNKDPGSIVEQYFIQPRGAFMNMNTLREDDYNSQALLSMLPVLDGAIQEEITRRINLDADGLDALDLKMVKILSSRIFQPVN